MCLSNISFFYDLVYTCMYVCATSLYLVNILVTYVVTQSKTKMVISLNTCSLITFDAVIYYYIILTVQRLASSVIMYLLSNSWSSRSNLSLCSLSGSSENVL